MVAIDYFTKWVEAASYKIVTATTMEKFIRNNIIAHYGVPHVEKDHGDDILCSYYWGAWMKFPWTWQLWHLSTNLQ